MYLRASILSTLKSQAWTLAEKIQLTGFSKKMCLSGLHTIPFPRQA